MTVLSPQEYAAFFTASLHEYDEQRPRSQQSRAGRIGVSDLWTCKERVRRTTLGEAPSDPTSRMSAIIGTAIHAAVAPARKAVGCLTEVPVTVTLPSGRALPGTVDEIYPAEPSVTDVKSSDGLSLVRRKGSDDQQRSQRHLYGKGAVDAGLVGGEGLVVRNVWVDRSGRCESVHVEQEPYDPAVLAAADEWLSDVDYAVAHGEEAEKTWHYCQACPFFTACRGQILTDGTIVRDASLGTAAAVMVDERPHQKSYNDLVEDCTRVLKGFTGLIEHEGRRFYVKTTHVNRGDGFDRLDVVREVA
jgi:hypothetical protein